MFGRRFMKKVKLALSVMTFLSVFVSTLMVTPIHAQSITPTPTWAGYTFKGVDPFYDDDVVAYEAGSTAILYVHVLNNYGLPINVSAVGIRLNWGDAFNSTQASKANPVTLENGESRIFTVTFVVPSIANVSNLFRWDYKIYIEHINATGFVVDTRIKTRNELALPYFVVYSADQAKFQQIANIIKGMPALKWNSTEARILSKKAENETSVAESYYKLGEFSNAVTHYEKALKLLNRAFAAEENIGTRREDVEITLLEAQVKWFEGWANFFNGLSNMWTLIGVALVLFALGYIIRGIAMLRRTQAPP
jgi:tetratricopeptide (TPR) repeat protein